VNRTLRAVPAGAGGVADLLPALRAALAGTGPAVLAGPVDQGPSARPIEVPDGVALVVPTSGSTGAPRAVMLSAQALRASAAATQTRLGGPAQWLLTLPPSHVAGLQVLVRSILAGTDPVLAAPGHFDPETFSADAARQTGARPYVSLVPTQLHRLLDAAGAGLAALAEFDAVLVGGAAAGDALLARAAAAGVRVTTTYGMSETCGGCVYAGRPLDGVRLALDDEGRILIAGAVLATGYLGRPDLDAQAFTTIRGERWLRTSDLGDLGPAGTGPLSVLGRADDVLVSGGTNVAPAAVERSLRELPGIGEVCVVGVPDPEWGQAVTAVVVRTAGAPAPELAVLRAHVTRNLGAPWAPRHLVVIDRLPVRGPGKTDRLATTELAAAALHRSPTGVTDRL